MSPSPDIDARTASAIAAAMRAVALADGQLHAGELTLIEAFEADLPDHVDPSGVRITDPAVREVLLHAMVATALADGRMGQAERAVIDELARAHGATLADVEAMLDTVRREMFAHFRGVHHFRDEALAIAHELGLSPDDALDILS